MGREISKNEIGNEKNAKMRLRGGNENNRHAAYSIRRFAQAFPRLAPISTFARIYPK